MTAIGEIFEIPDSVHQGDFVLRLTEGVQDDRRKQTLQQYVVTPQLAQCFDQALSLIESAVTNNSSKGAYLHGSFGSGKSHFMAVLDFLLEGDTEARSITELASVVSKHNRWWQGCKFLVVPFHMIGADSMEAAILGGYASYIRQHHPDAQTPGFYRSQALLEDADGLRQTMGDEAFFSKLGAGTGGDSGGWGAFSSGWDATSYDAAAKASPDDAEHQRLVGDLVDAFFAHLRRETSASNYVDLDRGLAVLSRHAQSLGYTTVVLFLDELILWLASYSQDQAFLAREGQKVSKLVEASDADRPIPIVSFIARQRDLRELVGKSVPGADRLAFDDVLQWWEARFDEIVLEDRNLPAIIERRLLRPRGEEQKQQLREAFEKTAGTRQEVLDILLTHEGDKQMFEQVYPFSPALVQALVALSGLLQRERTALKLMLQLLVQNRDTLALGDVIPVGSLFDVIIAADEPFTPAIKTLFDRARDVWTRKFVPLLEAEHDVSDQAVRDGEADADTARRYRAHAGLLKTLLLSALAPDVEALRNLTPQRLAALNHGTIRSPLPNQEATTVLSQVRDWASHAGEIQISADTSNPLISLQLSGVDVEGVLENARNIDNFGNRVRTVKELLFTDVGIDTSNGGMLTPEYTWYWRGRQRRAELLLQNVRECSDDNFRPGNGVWRLLIDYPFDQPEFNPNDDRARVDQFNESVHSLVWLPSFLNTRALDDLGRLGVLNHVLSGNRLEECSAHLQPAERSEARATLKNQRDQLEQRISAALKQAYGVAQGTESHIDTTHSLDEHFLSMHHGLRLQPPPGGEFKQSLEHLLDQALSSQYPAHPKFEIEVKPGGLRRAWAVLEQAVDTPDGRYGMERSHREEIKGIVQPLKLADCGEGHLVLSDHWRNHIERMMARDEVTTPNVRQLRDWIDEPEPMGLDEDIADLIILTWAAQTGRSLFLHNTSIPGELGKLNREAELREQALPPEHQWQEAVDRAANIFGEAGTGAGRNAGNVSALSQALETYAGEKQWALADYRKALADRLKSFDMDDSGARAQTAAASADLAVALATSEASERIRTLATATVNTSLAAMGAVMARTKELAEMLRSPRWDTIDLMRGRQEKAARDIVESLGAALADDEHVTHMEQQLSEQYQRALALMKAPTPPPEPPEPPPEPPASESSARSVSRHGATAHAARELLHEVEQALADDPALRADIECRIYTQETDDQKS